MMTSKRKSARLTLKDEFEKIPKKTKDNTKKIFESTATEVECGNSAMLQLETEMTMDKIPLENGKLLDMILENPVSQLKAYHYVIILTHGAGGDMRSGDLDKTAREICEKGFPVLRFTCKPMNFKYRLKCYSAVVDYVRRKYDFKGCYIGGRSMGSRVAAELASQDAKDDFIKGVISLAFPLHQPRQESSIRKSHLTSLKVPLLFISGSKDPMCKMNLMVLILKELVCPMEVHWLNGVDHSLKSKSKTINGNANMDISAIIYDWCYRNMELKT